MHAVDIDGRRLVVTREHVAFAGRELPIAEIEALNVTRTDHHVHGAWVEGTRVIDLRAADRMLSIDCSRAFPSRNRLDRAFAGAFDPIWSVVGWRLVDRLVGRLAGGESVRIGGIRVDRDGVWVDGSWSFLWWKAPPKLIAWRDLRTFSSDGSLFFESIGDVRYRSEVKVNDTDNALVLDAAVRLLLQDNNWRKLRDRPHAMK